MKKCFFSLFIILIFTASVCVYGAETTGALAKKLQNPIANLISVPFQNNFTHRLGSRSDGFNYTLNFQPVIPFSLNNDWNLIFRPIIPFIYQHDVIGNIRQKGFGDVLIEPFFSPKKPGIGGILWGTGPILLIPTYANDHLGHKKYGLGPNVCVIKQTGPWTIGALVNHIWSYAGGGNKNISSTYVQPMISHTSKRGFTVGVSSESTYDWNSNNGRLSLPFIGSVSQVLPLFGKYVSIGVGGIYFLQSPKLGPKWSLRTTVTFLLPEKIQAI